jgi:hypothetical protein
MLRALLVCPMRFSVRVSPITMKPAKVKMFMPNRISLVSISRPFVPVVLRRAQGVRCSPAPTRGSGSSSLYSEHLAAVSTFAPTQQRR